GERLAKAGGVGCSRSKLRQERGAHRLQRRRRDELAAQPPRQRVEAELVAQARIRRGEAIEQLDRERLAAGVVGNGPLGLLERLEPGGVEACGRARRAYGRSAAEKQCADRETQP